MPPTPLVTRRELLALPLAAAIARAVAPPSELAEVRAYIEEKVTRGIVPSLAVAVSRRGELIWSEAFGYADLESRRRATTDTIYKLASLSKPITATALMLLVDRGLVDLDAPANDYLRGAKLRAHSGSASDITVRRLLNHTAGIPTHENLFFDGVPVLPRDETIRRHGFAAWPPGSRVHYSNLGTAVLGFITEDVTRMPWERFLESALFRPLGMTRTANGIKRGHEHEAAVPYDYDIASRFVRTGEHRTDHPGASSLRSTVHDLLRFLEIHLGHKLLSRQSAVLMQTESSKGYSLGFQIDDRSFFHGGGGPGMGAWMRAFPREQIAFAVLTNYFGAMAEQVGKRISAALVSEYGGKAAVLESGGSAAALRNGTWRGALEHHQGPVPITLTLPDGEIRFGTSPAPQRLRDLTMTGDELTGTAEGILDVHAGYHGPSQLEFHLRRESDVLRGVCHVYAKGYFELAHWTELRRA